MAPVPRPGVEAVGGRGRDVAPAVDPRPRAPHDAIRTPRVVESGEVTAAPDARRILERIGPASADHANENAVPDRAPNHDVVRSTVQMQPDLLRLGAIEGPGEIRGRQTGAPHLRPAVQVDGDALVVQALDRGDVGLVGGVDVGVVGEQCVQSQRGRRQRVAPPFEVARQLRAIQAVVLGRQLPHRRVDDAVGEACLQRPGRRVPHGSPEVAEQPAVEILSAPAQPIHAAVIGTEPDELGVRAPGQPRQQPVETGERFIAIPRDRAPHVVVALFEPRPAPLVGVAVAVGEIEIDQARGEICARVHTMAGAMLQVLEQPGRSHNVARAAEPWLATLAFVGALLDEPEHPREGGAELAQPRVVRHHQQVRRRVQHAGRVEQGSCHQRGGGVQHAELILEDALGHRGLEVRRQPGGPLVDRAEYILPAVGAGEAERLRLTAAAPPHRHESPGEAREIEALHGERRRPQRAVMLAEQHLVQPPCAVLGSRGYSDAVASVGQRVTGALRRQPRRAECEDQDGETRPAGRTQAVTRPWRNRAGSGTPPRSHGARHVS